jgi:hypothetical protein
MDASSDRRIPVLSTTGRFDRIAVAPWYSSRCAPPVTNYSPLRHATEELPLQRVEISTRGSRKVRTMRVTAFGFNDALAIWQLMGCITAGSTAAVDGRQPSRGRDRTLSVRGARLASDAPAESINACRAAPSCRSTARYARRGTVLYFSGSPVSPFPATDA